MLLKNLEIENLRGFEKYTLRDLARVNLLVGKNNCGKTTVLEAAMLLGSRCEFRTLAMACEKRGETGLRRDGDGFSKRVAINPRDLFFHGNRTKSFLSVSDGVESATVEVFNTRMLTSTSPDVALPLLECKFTGTESSHFRRQINIDGLVDYESITSCKLSGYEADESVVAFLPASGVRLDDMRRDWSRLLQSNHEGVAEESLRILFPELNRVIFSPTDGPGDSRREVYIDASNGRYSLSETGEGTYRLLALGIALACGATGVLVVDEIDTGLHYTVLADMWRMVIKSAQELDLQVFATTHSSDCLRALRDTVEADASLRDEIAVYSIDRRFDEAVRFDSHSLDIALEQEIEVR